MILLKPKGLVVLVGPNGSGKSTLAKKLALKNKWFLCFQNPVSIPNVNYSHFLRLAYNKNLPRRQAGHKPLDPFSFYEILQKSAAVLNLPEKLFDKDLNCEISGGEKKKMELLQALVLKPKFAILDEPDSGVDTDSLPKIAAAIKILQKTTGVLLITHSPSLLALLSPNKTYKMENNKILNF